MKKAPIILLMLLAMASYAQNKQKVLKKEESENGDKVQVYSNENKDMNAAVAEAKRSYPEFERVLAAKDASTSDFTVKMRFDYENGGEHMWLNELHEKNGKLHGVLNSDPMYVKNLRFGDTLQIKKDAISDWMYVKGKKMIGGYTIRVSYNNMNRAEKKDFKATFPFEFE